MLRAIQAEQRTQRDDMTLLRGELTRLREAQAHFVTREDLFEVLTVITGRIGNFEALMETRMDQTGAQLDVRFAGLSAQIAAIKGGGT